MPTGGSSSIHEPLNTVGVASVVGGPVSVTDGGGSLTVDGTVGVNNFPADREVSVLCDPGAGNFPFLRRYSVTSGGVVSFTDTLLDGVTPYTPVGTPTVCYANRINVGSQTSSIIVTRLIGVYPSPLAERVTSTLARRVQILFPGTGNPAGTRPTLNGVPMANFSTSSTVQIVLGSLESGLTLPAFTVRNRSAASEMTVIEEL